MDAKDEVKEVKSEDSLLVVLLFQVPKSPQNLRLRRSFLDGMSDEFKHLFKECSMMAE